MISLLRATNKRLPILVLMVTISRTSPSSIRPVCFAGTGVKFNPGEPYKKVP